MKPFLADLRIIHQIRKGRCEVKRFLGKCIEYTFVALVFIGLFYTLRFIVDGMDAADLLTLVGSLFLVFPLSLFGGYFLARPIQRRLEGKGTATSHGRELRGNEKPHGVTEDRNSPFSDGG